MARQFTFKTTQTTEWLDPILEGMGRNERSEFIRDAIIAKLGAHSEVRQKVTQIVTHSHTVKPTIVPDAPDFIVKESVLEDLDSKLDNLNF